MGIIRGINRTVVADSAIPNRYHIFTTIPLDETKAGYSIVEDGEVVTNISSLSPEMDSTSPSAISFYDSVRKLNNFDKNQCPLIEIQTVGNNNYFLQYHRGTRFNPSQFMLDREPEEGELKATFVRGATVKEGMIARVSIHYGDESTSVQEDGAIDNPAIKIFTEFMVRQRKLQLATAEDMRNLTSSVTGEHLTKSVLFKPQISIVLKSDELFPLFGAYQPDSNSVRQIQLKVVSDGRNAYVKKVE